MPKIVFEWQQARSDASHRGWEMRWERGESVGPKGSAYLEREYGPVGIPPDRYDEEQDYDYWDFEDESDY